MTSPYLTQTDAMTYACKKDRGSFIAWANENRLTGRKVGGNMLYVKAELINAIEAGCQPLPKEVNRGFSTGRKVASNIVDPLAGWRKQKPRKPVTQRSLN